MGVWEREKGRGGCRAQEQVVGGAHTDACCAAGDRGRRSRTATRAAPQTVGGHGRVNG